MYEANRARQTRGRRRSTPCCHGDAAVAARASGRMLTEIPRDRGTPTGGGGRVSPHLGKPPDGPPATAPEDARIDSALRPVQATEADTGGGRGGRPPHAAERFEHPKCRAQLRFRYPTHASTQSVQRRGFRRKGVEHPKETAAARPALLDQTVLDATVLSPAINRHSADSPSRPARPACCTYASSEPGRPM